ncbi:MAG: tetratricopeptide repeat protein [Alphaproteobacteria bacterium]|nr:tetratricopeptide repeat protein [Alphaproteobacteria bacterium]
MLKSFLHPGQAKAAVLACCALLAACQPSQQKALLAEPGQSWQDLQNLSTATDVAQAKIHFRNGDYGLAQSYYQRAVAANPKDREALLGLAASYDELRRFDLSDKIYGLVGSNYGDDPVVLNNIGYSYLMRGDLAQARKFLSRARELAPENTVIQHNIALLNEKKQTL